MNDQTKTHEPAAMVAMREQHLASELGAKCTDATLEAVTEPPSVNAVPLAAGGENGGGTSGNHGNGTAG